MVFEERWSEPPTQHCQISAYPTVSKGALVEVDDDCKNGGGEAGCLSDQHAPTIEQVQLKRR